MLNFVRLRWRWLMIGIVLLILLGVGFYTRLPTFQRPAAIHVPLENLLATRERYIGQFVEVQGKYGYFGIAECEPGPLALFFNNPNRRIIIDLAPSVPPEASVLFDKNSSGPVIVRGWVRRYNPSACGSFGAIYIEVESIESPGPTPMK